MRPPREPRPGRNSERNGFSEVAAEVSAENPCGRLPGMAKADVLKFPAARFTI
ncbi:hypothetical protein B4135_0427 [Caldibacillus debilis]|uniref:Uncharacterized protein n=1 Tax=Caldibacillus debilis TaxID=301148 RepID=A0A150L906_9BACI|nr:hypothetical protein B4135_0427 [Caldibacillus debilis]